MKKIKLNLKNDLISFLSKDEKELLKNILEEAGFIDTDFDEVRIRRNEIRFYIDEFFICFLRKNGKWEVKVFDIEGKEADADVNVRALMEMLENKLNKENK